MSKEQKPVIRLAADPGAQWRFWEDLPRGSKADGGGKPSTGTKGGKAIHLPIECLYANGGDGEKGGKAIHLSAEPGAEWRFWEDWPSASNTARTNPFAPPGTGGSGPTPRHGTPVRGHGRTISKGNAHSVRGHMRKG